MPVRLSTNVLCVKDFEGKWRLTEKEIASRLSYFQLLELCRINPNRFPASWHADDQLTARQRSQRDSFLRERMWHLWDRDPGLHPLPGKQTPNPFLGPPEAAPVARKPASVPTEDSAPQAADDVSPQIRRQDQSNAVPGEAEQDRVLLAAATEDLFVIAPPGTGKTHVLVERIAHLVESGASPNPSSEILVLSFTRSAVAEVKRRLLSKVEGGSHPDVAYARVLTFDALATRSLLQDRDPQLLAGRNFEQRIDLFTKQVGDALPNAYATLAEVRYLFVDEVQDLCGVRAAMVLKIAGIVKASGGSVCFLGDPAQAIYDFDQEDEAASSAAFLAAISEGSYAESPPPSRVSFSEYRRFESAEMLGFVSSARVAMGEDGLHPDGVRLAQLIQELQAKFGSLTLEGFAQQPGRKAILARTNLQAYQIWRQCERQNIPAELWRGAAGNYWPGWIGRLVLGYKHDVMSLDIAEERWDRFRSTVSVTFEEAMALLRREGVVEDERIDLSRLNSVIGAGAPSAMRPQNEMVISTIHRSKGLEFEHVLAYRPKENFGGKADEVRVLYVAATRAKRDFRIIGAIDNMRPGYKNDRYGLSTSRFHVLKFREPDILGLLIDSADETDAMPGEDRHATATPRQMAEILWNECGLGIPRDAEIVVNGAATAKVVLGGGQEVGSAAAGLVQDLQRIARWQRATLERCTGLQIVGVATKAVDISHTAAKEALGSACLALVPVISGIGAVITRKQ